MSEPGVSIVKGRLDTVDESEVPSPGGARPDSSASRSRVTRGLFFAWQWFRAFRRTRPFWGGFWTILAGLWIIRAMNFSIGLALTGGWSYAAGYVMGGGLVLFGVVTWVAPHYKGLCALVAFIIALLAFPTANLGGYLIGSVLGIIGSSMIWAWGEKKPKKPKGTGRRAVRDVGRDAEVSDG